MLLRLFCSVRLTRLRPLTCFLATVSSDLHWANSGSWSVDINNQHILLDIYVQRKSWTRSMHVHSGSLAAIGTHQSWDQSCRQLRSSYPGRLARRSRPAPAPEGEVVWGGSHCLQARGLRDRCHCSSPESRPAGETWRAAATRTKSTKQSLWC